MKGFIYVLSHKAMPNLHKIGYTTRTVDDRINELSSTGVPGKFIAEIYFHVDNAPLVEELIHKLLNQYVYEKEFFQTDIITIISVIYKLRENGTLQISEFFGRSKNKALSDDDKVKIAQEIVNANKFAEDEFKEFKDLKYHELLSKQNFLWIDITRKGYNYEIRRKLKIIEKCIKIHENENNKRLQLVYKIEDKLEQKDRFIFDKYSNDFIEKGILVNNIIEADNKKRFFKVINSYSFERGRNLYLTANDKKVIYNFLEIYLIIIDLRCREFSQYFSYPLNFNDFKWLFNDDNVKNRTPIFNGLLFNFINVLQAESGEMRIFALKCRETLAPFLRP